MHKIQTTFLGSIYIFLFLFSSNLIFAQETQFYFFDWIIDHENDRNLSDKKVIIPDNWLIHTGSDWKKISIPFVCMDYRALELKSTFLIDSISAIRGVHLSVQGAGGSAEIYLNQRLLQFVPNAQIPIQLKINNDVLQTSAQNEIIIKFRLPKTVDEGYPVFSNLFTEPQYLGIVKPVSISVIPEYQAKNFKYQINKIGDICEVDYSFNLNVLEKIIHPAIPASIDYSILGANRKLYHRRIKTINTLSSTMSGVLKISKTELWHPDNPNNVDLVYTIAKNNVILYKDTLTVALRMFKYRREQFYLNGDKISIHGINYYQNYQIFTDKKYYDKIYYDLKNIKKYGFNSVRFPGYFPNKMIAGIADSLGLLLFTELPIKRYPISLFQNDNMLENTKSSIKHASFFAQTHPSIVAFGIGQEIPLYEGSVQKFYLILDGFAKSITSNAMYISPIPSTTVYREKITDFYLLDIYNPLQLTVNKNIFARQYALAGKVGIIRNSDVQKWDSEPSNISRAVFLSQEMQALSSVFPFSGGFIESYRDWQAKVPTHISIKQDNPLIMPNGIMRENAEPKLWLSTIDNIWELENKSNIGEKNIKETTNFFSILMVFASLLFLAIYRKYPRLKDNLKRAIRHPYGFFVDMRERRIIPFLNSFLVGAFSALILASYLGSFLYYYRDSFWMQEISCLFLKPIDIYYYYLEYFSSPLSITIVFFILLFMYPIVVSIILYLINLFNLRKIRYRQGLAIALWSGVPLFFLLPISIIGYHLLYYLENQAMLFMILGIFIIWSHFRIINGIRVLFITKAVKIFIIMLLSYIIPILIFWAVFRPESHWYDYFMLLMKSKSLF